MARKLRYNDEEGGMAKAQLQKIEMYAAKLNEMIHPDDELEGWVQAKLAVVAAYMGDVKHYLDYELKEAFGEGGSVSMKQRYWEVEFTWDGAREEESREVNVMADSVGDAERKVKEKFGSYYKGLRILEIEEDKEMTWDEYADKKGKMADGGTIDEKVASLRKQKEDLREQFNNAQMDGKNTDKLLVKIQKINNELNSALKEKFSSTKMADGGEILIQDDLYKLVLDMDEDEYVAFAKVQEVDIDDPNGLDDFIYELPMREAKMILADIKKGKYKKGKMADGGVVEKAFVEITKPTDLKTKAVAEKIEDLVDMGYKSADILLKMAFVTTDVKPLEDQFRIIKNNIFYKKGREKFGKGGKMEDLFMKYEGSTYAEDMKEAQEYLGDETWNNFTKDEKVEAMKYLKAQGLIGYYGELEDIETLSAMQYKKGGKAK